MVLILGKVKIPKKSHPKTAFWGIKIF